MGEWLNNLINNNITSIIITGITGAISWFFTKRHFQSKELKSKDLQNEESTSNVVGQNLELYQRMLDDYTERKDKELQDAYDKIEALKIKVEKLEKENASLKSRIKKLEKE